MSKAAKRVNFKPFDRQLLAQLVGAHREVIKDKGKSAAANQKKERAWAQISAAFNGNSNVAFKRTSEQLRKGWENMCHKAKDDISKRKPSAQPTGEDLSLGPIPVEGETELDPLTEAVAEVLGSVLKDPLEGEATSLREEDGLTFDLVTEVEDSETLPADTETPMPATTSRHDEYFRRRKRTVTPGSGEAAAGELLKMRREEHEKKMLKLEWETAYWRARYIKEFGYLEMPASLASRL